MNTSRKILASIAFVVIMLPCAIFAQQPTITISVQQNNGNGTIRVGGRYTYADYVTIDCRNLTDNTVIQNQAVQVGSGSWYYDKPVEARKKYRFAVKASNKAGAVRWAQIEITAEFMGPLPPTYTTQTVNAYRWTNTSASIYSDINLTNRITSLNKDTKVYVSNKYVFNSGKTVAKINEGYVDANNLTVTAVEKIQRRYIACEMLDVDGMYAAFAEGRLLKSEVGSNINIGLSTSISDLITASAGAGISSTYVYGVRIPRGEAVNYFPKKDNGNTMEIKTTKGNAIYVPTEKGNTVLIGWQNAYYYVSRECLGTDPLPKTQVNNVSPSAAPNQPQQQTYNTSHFVKTGNAKPYSYNGKNYIGEINNTNGFRFSVNSNSAKIVIFSLLYRSDNRGGKLIVNGVTQNISFSSTNWNWGTKEIQGIRLRQGTNTIEFKGGYQTSYAPDIAEITIR
ncbi:MAG: hypothetical protein LBB84_02555 [Tannerellaceae bacterium]|jgi:hypothetical protein|nr:hypothetical protein [Tannerellaceae bacterium]